MSKGLSLSLKVGILLFFCGCGWSAVETASPAQPDAGCVWMVESASGGRLYLCGTIHLLRKADYPLPSAYGTAYEGSDELIFELPPGTSSGPELSNRMKQLGTLPASESLKNRISKAAWKQVSEWSLKRGLDPAVMDRLRPWFASLLMVATEYQLLGAAPELGVDQHFEERAKKDGKAGRGLETVDQQLALFSNMTEKQELEVLEQTLAEMVSVEAEYDNMIRAWRTGNLDALLELLFREAEKHPELMEAFLNARNRAWVPALEQVLKRRGRAMVLVGAGHLGGEQGLINLLRGKGYEVRQVGKAL